MFGLFVVFYYSYIITYNQYNFIFIARLRSNLLLKHVYNSIRLENTSRDRFAKLLHYVRNDGQCFNVPNNSNLQCTAFSDLQSENLNLLYKYITFGLHPTVVRAISQM
jgi:hypothetical protein